MQVKKTILLLFSSIFSAMLLWCLGFVFFVRQIDSYQISKDRTDAIVVLTGGRHRIEEGISLLNNGIGDKLFISGVSKKTSLQEIEKKSKIKINDSHKIYLGYNATDTISNAAEIVDWITQNDVHSLHLVTSNYHLPRALEELSVYRLPVKVIAHPVYSEKIIKKWWHSFSTFKLLAAEYNKFLYTYLNHRRLQLLEK